MNLSNIDSSAARAAQQQALNIAEIMVRGSARMLELQTSAARAVLQMQGRNAALLGVPDWSNLFTGQGAEQLESLFQTGADQSVHFLRTANEAIQQVQRQFGELMERQTQQVADQMRRSVEEMTRRSREGMEQLSRVSDEAMQRAQRASEEAEREIPQPQEAAPASPSPIITPGIDAAGTSVEERARSRRSA
jgi:hypothetical protein